MRILLLILICTLGLRVHSQDFDTFYSYSLDLNNINNAYVGAGGTFEGLVVSRSQFNNVVGSPQNLMALFSAKVSPLQGVGIKVISDRRGIFNTSRYDAVYSHRFNFNTSSRYIRFGLSFGAITSSLDLSNANNSDEILATGDPLLTSSQYNYTHFISGFGTVLGYDNFEIGLSAPHLIESADGIQQYFVGILKYQYEIPASKFSVSPSVVYQNRPNLENVADGFLTMSWDKLVSLIAGYTSDQRMKLGIGLQLKDFGVSYLAENPMASNQFANNTHEIALRFAVNKSKKPELTNVRTAIERLIVETGELASDEYDKDYLKKRLLEIDRELDTILLQNKGENSVDVSKLLNQLEAQILFIIDKYKLENE